MMFFICRTSSYTARKQQRVKDNTMGALIYAIELVEEEGLKERNIGVFEQLRWVYRWLVLMSKFRAWKTIINNSISYLISINIKLNK